MNSRLALSALTLAIVVGGLVLWQALGGERSRQQPTPGELVGQVEDAQGEIDADSAELVLPTSADRSAAGLSAGRSAQGLEPGHTGHTGHDGHDGHDGHAGYSDQAKVRVTGVVLDHQGQPVAGAEVSGRPDESDYFSYSSGDPFGESVLTDAQGAFELPDKQAGALRLRVLAQGFAPYVQGGIALPQEPEVSVGELRLQPGLTLVGIVRDRAGAPVSGASLYSETESTSALGTPERTWLAETDERGGFVVDKLAPGRWRLLAQSALHVDGVLEGEHREPGSRVEGLVIELDEGQRLSGVVLGLSAGQPHALEVHARHTSSKNPWAEPQRTASVQTDGRFEFLGMRSDGEYDLGLYPSDESLNSHFEPPHSKPVRAKGGEHNVELQYLAGSTLSFQVIDARSKEPITGLVVRAGFGWPRPLMDEDRRMLKEFPDGRVRFSGLRPQLDSKLCELQVSSVGYRDYGRKDIALGHNEELDLGVIELEPIPVVRVTVVEQATGLPIVGAMVLMRQESGDQGGLRALGYVEGDGHAEISGAEEVRGVTGSDGVAVISSLEDQIVALRVSRPGYATRVRRNLHLPLRRDHAEQVELGPGGEVQVSVMHADGTPAGGLKVLQRRWPDDANDLAWRSVGSRPSVTDSSGQVSFRNLRPGVYSYRIPEEQEHAGGWGLGSSSEDQWAGSARLTIEEGGVQELTLKAPALCDLVGSLIEAGKPLVGATLRLVEESKAEQLEHAFFGMNEAKETSDNAGHYRFAGQREGSYRLLVKHSSRAMEASFPIRLVEGQNRADVTLSVSIIEGRVVSEAGDPIEGVRVTAQRASGEAENPGGFIMLSGNGASILDLSQQNKREDVSDAAGRFSLRGVMPGIELVLSAKGPGVQPLKTEPLVVAPDEVRETSDLVMQLGGSVRLEFFQDGEPVSFCSLSAVWAGEPSGVVPLHEVFQQGKGLLEGLRPGPWRLQASSLVIGAGSKAAEAVVEVEVREGEEFFQVLHLEPKP